MIIIICYTKISKPFLISFLLECASSNLEDRRPMPDPVRFRCVTNLLTSRNIKVFFSIKCIGESESVW